MGRLLGDRTSVPLVALFVPAIALLLTTWSVRVVEAKSIGAGKGNDSDSLFHVEPERLVLDDDHDDDASEKDTDFVVKVNHTKSTTTTKTLQEQLLDAIANDRFKFDDDDKVPSYDPDNSWKSGKVKEQPLPPSWLFDNDNKVLLDNLNRKMNKTSWWSVSRPSLESYVPPSSYDDILKNYDYKVPDPPIYPSYKLNYNSDSDSYSTHSSSSYYNNYNGRGVTGYHVGGGFFVFAICILTIRCCLLCCRVSEAERVNRRGAIILVRETAVVVQTRRPRSNSNEDLVGNEEGPAEDPPTYDDCTKSTMIAPPPPYGFVIGEPPAGDGEVGECEKPAMTTGPTVGQNAA